METYLRSNGPLKSHHKYIKGETNMGINNSTDEMEFRILNISDLISTYKYLVLLRHPINETNDSDEPLIFISDTIDFIHHTIIQELNHKKHQELIGN